MFGLLKTGGVSISGTTEDLDCFDVRVAEDGGCFDVWVC